MCVILIFILPEILFSNHESNQIKQWMSMRKKRTDEKVIEEMFNYSKFES